MKITITTVGRPRERNIAALSEHYLARLRPFASVTLESVLESRDPSPDRKREKEGEALIRALRERDFVVILDEEGRSFSSITFSSWLESKMEEEPGRIVLVIGGAYGLSERVKRRSDSAVSLSEMTMPHELCLVFLLEQLYRAFSIINGHKYHH